MPAVSYNEVFARQRDIILPPSAATVIGVGGVGSWVAYILASIGTKDITLIDPDVVEPHNIPRTPYKAIHTGLGKVFAMKHIIMERFPFINVNPIQDKVEDVVGDVEGVVFDCRDEPFYTLPEVIKERVRVCGGYNGHKITIHYKPNEYQIPIWGHEVTYGVGSYIMPPMLIAVMFVWLTLYSEANAGIFTGTIEDIVNKILG